MKILVTGVKEFIGWNFMRVLGLERAGWSQCAFYGNLLDSAEAQAIADALESGGYLPPTPQYWMPPKPARGPEAAAS